MLVRRCSLSRLELLVQPGASAAPRLSSFSRLVGSPGASQSLFLFAPERLFCDLVP